MDLGEKERGKNKIIGMGKLSRKISKVYDCTLI